MQEMVVEIFFYLECLIENELGCGEHGIPSSQRYRAVIDVQGRGRTELASGESTRGRTQRKKGGLKIYRIRFDRFARSRTYVKRDRGA